MMRHKLRSKRGTVLFPAANISEGVPSRLVLLASLPLISTKVQSQTASVQIKQETTIIALQKTLIHT